MLAPLCWVSPYLKTPHLDLRELSHGVVNCSDLNNCTAPLVDLLRLLHRRSISVRLWKEHRGGETFFAKNCRVRLEIGPLTMRPDGTAVIRERPDDKRHTVMRKLLIKILREGRDQIADSLRIPGRPGLGRIVRPNFEGDARSSGQNRPAADALSRSSSGH